MCKTSGSIAQIRSALQILDHRDTAHKRATRRLMLLDTFGVDSALAQARLFTGDSDQSCLSQVSVLDML